MGFDSLHIEALAVWECGSGLNTQSPVVHILDSHPQACDKAMGFDSLHIEASAVRECGSELNSQPFELVMASKELLNRGA